MASEVPGSSSNRYSVSGSSTHCRVLAPMLISDECGFPSLSSRPKLDMSNHSGRVITPRERNFYSESLQCTTSLDLYKTIPGALLALEVNAQW